MAKHADVYILPRITMPAFIEIRYQLLEAGYNTSKRTQIKGRHFTFTTLKFVHG